jgi:hypothetical protein
VPPSGTRSAGEVAPEESIAREAADQIATNGLLKDKEAVAEVIEQHATVPDQEPGQAERDRHAEDVVEKLATAVRLLREACIQNDVAEMPFIRVIGRILHILTVDGGKGSCAVGPIAVALLLFLEKHLDPEHRQPGTSRDTIDVTEMRLQRLLYNRLGRLIKRRYALQLKSLGGYQLTEDGRFVFRDWPEDITFDPRNPSLWEKKKPSTRGGGGPSPLKSRVTRSRPRPPSE